MLTSFIFAIVGYTLLAVVSILDKSLITTSRSKPGVYTFYSTIFLLALVILLPFADLPGKTDLMWAVVSGLAFGLAMWTLFIATKEGEASHITPFVGALTSAGTFGLSFILLGENLTANQQIGLLILVCATFLLSYEKSAKHNGFLHPGFVWGALAGILFAFSHVTSKHIYEVYPFLTGLIWTKVSAGCVGLFMLVMPSIRQQIFHQQIPQKTGVLFASNKVLSIIATLAIQYAIAIGSVTIVNGLAGIQYALIFVFIFCLTKTAPHLFSEEFTRKEITFQVSAIVLIGIGILFLH